VIAAPVVPPPPIVPPIIPPTVPPAVPPTVPPVVPPTAPPTVPPIVPPAVPPTAPPVVPPVVPPTVPPTVPPVVPPTVPPVVPPIIPPTVPPTPAPAPVPDCTSVPPVQPGSSVSGAFSATTCRNLHGLAIAQQYRITAAQQLTFAIQYTATASAALVPLHLGASFHAPVTRSATPYIVVMRPGTFGFLMSAGAGSTASYVVRTSRDPDPRQTCTTTYVTRGVRFSSALSAASDSRDIRVVDLIERSQRISVSVTTPGEPGGAGADRCRDR
jgi:hypothetical protein